MKGDVESQYAVSRSTQTTLGGAGWNHRAVAQGRGRFTLKEDPPSIQTLQLSRNASPQPINDAGVYAAAERDLGLPDKSVENAHFRAFLVAAIDSFGIVLF